mgnify:CR=1 FL=1|tara:strand:- start:18205 stop:18462 length:258 start_codon:yes stop_codon:yes gene_type:complete
MSILYDIMYSPEKKLGKKPMKKREKNKLYDKIDDLIKKCVSCNCCWEKAFNTSASGDNYYNYYKDFPAYGKEKEICPKCLKQLED